MKLLLIPTNDQMLLADPTIISKEESPDNQYHMYCHSAYGVIEYISDDAKDWKLKQTVVPSEFNTQTENLLLKNTGTNFFNILGLIVKYFFSYKKGSFSSFLRAYVFIDNGVYYLYYQNEKFNWKNFMVTLPPESAIYCISSKDLMNWSKPKLIIADQPGYPFVSAPSVIKENGKYRLYFTFDYKFTGDSSMMEPVNVATAISSTPDGDFTNIERVRVYKNDKLVKQVGSFRVRIIDNQVIYTCNPLYVVKGEFTSIIYTANKIKENEFALDRRLIEHEEYKVEKITEAYVLDLVKVGNEVISIFNTRRVHKLFDKMTFNGGVVSTFMIVMIAVFFSREDLYFKIIDGISKKIE